MSYLLAALCIISTAQQASPNVIGHRLPFLAQLTRSSTRDTVYSTLLETGEPVSMGSIEDTCVTLPVVDDLNLLRVKDGEA
eukprot:CAMPEP_0118653132 /NCGR_PEP_ID=MMETSP0785-20121206/11675_1 /TAXON_ID=91992 /ORGANISM="Bolidomonas pacifica, Strain CCMP 1866" /LENGTH=80 /DNA_ID=CAMNT_0006545669 /DNA_START=303 /DNA_END=542 /DNA_ORIENTATION=-